MSTTEKIEGLLKEAMLKKDEQAVSLYRLLKSAIKNAEIEKRAGLEEGEVLAVLEKQAKQRRDSVEQYESGDRSDLAEKEKTELAVIESFLPEKMSEEEVRTIVKEKISSMAEAQFGQIMGACMAELKGKADGATVQAILKEEMGQ